MKLLGQGSLLSALLGSRVRVPWITVALAGAAVLVHVLGVSRPLVSDAQGLARGEAWRLFTCHLVHWSHSHALWDIGMFLGLGSVAEIMNRRRLCGALFAGAPCIALAVLFARPDLAAYAGLSGLDTGLFVLVAAGSSRRLWRACDVAGRSALLALPLAALAKLVFEFSTSAMLFVTEQPDVFVPVPEAHLAGALAAACVVLSAKKREPGTCASPEARPRPA